jgi:hypothetical protein
MVQGLAAVNRRHYCKCVTAKVQGLAAATGMVTEEVGETHRKMSPARLSFVSIASAQRNGTESTAMYTVQNDNAFQEEDSDST